MMADQSKPAIGLPTSCDELRALVTRWNALSSETGVPANGSLEMLQLTEVLRQVEDQQSRYESNLARLQAERQRQKTKKPSSGQSLRPLLAAFKLLSRGIDLPEDLELELSCLREGVPNGKVSAKPTAARPRAEELLRPSPLRENVIKNRVNQRIRDLENIPANLGSVDVRSPKILAPDDLDSVDDNIKLRAAVELKSLRLLPRQKALRSIVVSYLAAIHPESQIAYEQVMRSNHRRPRIAPGDEFHLTEHLERKHRLERERLALKSQQQLVRLSSARIEEWKQQESQRQLRKTQFIKHLMQFHGHVEREQSKRAERTARQRLTALRANDEEAYIKLLDQTKDTRITHLLRQTNQFLASLSEAVRVQQHEGGTALPPPTEQELEQIDYYEVAHRIKEPVTKQASLLVGGQLKEYQIKGLQWMVSLVNNNLNGILADEMGLGKTIQSISLITYLIEAKRWPGPFLVIVPLSTITNWNVEFDKWAPSVRKIVYKGPPNARRAQQMAIRAGDFQVLLTTYEYVIKDRPILSKIRWQHMIIDEGHRMKNTQSKLSNTLVNYYHSRHRLILTGTPLQNNLPELWALLNFVLPKIFNSQKTFDEWFNTPFANAGGQDKMELSEEESLLIIRRLHKVLRPFLLRRLKKDVEKDLPDKVEKVVKCKMSALQHVLYHQMLEYHAIYTGMGPDNKVNGRTSGTHSGVRGLNNKIMQLRKICNHPFVFEEVENLIDPSHIKYELLWRTAGKFELLDRILPKFQCTGHRVLMFFQMTQIMDIMEDYLRSKDVKYLRLDGSTKADERSEKLKLFNAPDSPYFCFLLSTRAGGLGLNLQTADTVIIYDTDWNPFQDLQAQDRAHRIGQTKEVRILRLITGNSVEEAVLDRALQKLEIDGKVIQAGKFDNKSTAEEQEAFLRNLMEAEEARRENKADEEEMDDEELNEILARGDSEKELFNRMDKERLNQEDGKTPRLFSQDELPEIYKRDLFAEMQEANAAALLGVGAGSRRERRRQTVYDDGLTDAEWLKAMEQEAEEAAEAAKKTDEDFDVSPQDENDDDEDDDEAFEDEYSDTKPVAPPTPSPPSGRRSSARSARPKRGLPLSPNVEGSSPKKAKRESDTFLAKANALMDAILASTAPTDPPRSRAGIFLKLPSKRMYPDYYKIIKDPISLDEIRKKIDGDIYTSLEQLRQDLLLMISNARTYNAKGSVVYEDAGVLQGIIRKFRK